MCYVHEVLIFFLDFVLHQRNNLRKNLLQRNKQWNKNKRKTRSIHSDVGVEERVFFVYIELKISYKQFLIFLNFMNSFLTFLKLKEWLYKTIAHACEKMWASDLAIKVFMIKLTLRQSIYTFLHF